MTNSSKPVSQSPSGDVKMEFQIIVHCHTNALTDRTPEDIRFCVAQALEQSEKPALQEEVDFTLEVFRTYEQA